MIRRFLCRWFSMHDMVTTVSFGQWDHCVCIHCGLEANVNPYTHEVRFET